MNEDKVIEKLLEHDKRFDGHEIRLDRITDKLFEHDEKFVSLETEIKEFKAEYLRGQDQIMKILTRLDDERVFTVEAIRRMQDELDLQKRQINEHDVLLSKIKLELKVA